MNKENLKYIVGLILFILVMSGGETVKKEAGGFTLGAGIGTLLLGAGIFAVSIFAGPAIGVTAFGLAVISGLVSMVGGAGLIGSGISSLLKPQPTIPGYVWIVGIFALLLVVKLFRRK